MLKLEGHVVEHTSLWDKAWLGTHRPVPIPTILILFLLSESKVTNGQVWWPILGICALHFTHPKCTHTQSHTRNSGQPLMQLCPGSIGGFGALLKGTSVMVLKVEESAVSSQPPPTNSAGPRFELATFGLRVQLSNLCVTTSPRLPFLRFWPSREIFCLFQ